VSEVRIAAESRTEFGKGPARRTRRAGKVPAVLYGHGDKPRHLSLPGHSVCNLKTSGYGAAFWGESCTPERMPVTLTVVIKNAATAHPSMQFFPAMRFNPAKTVQLFMYAPHVSPTDAKNWLMLYCPDKGACFDESLTDKSLTTFIDYKSNVVFRRVKHFSGYTVAERTDLLPPDGL